MVVGRVEDARWREVLGRVVIGSCKPQDLLHDVAGAVEGDGGARAAHSADEILALAVDKADDGVLVGREAGGAAPLVGNFDRIGVEVSVHLADEEFGDKEEGFEPGTRLQDIPKDWGCPDCGAVKEKFIEKE